MMTPGMGGMIGGRPPDGGMVGRPPGRGMDGSAPGMVPGMQHQMGGFLEKGDEEKIKYKLSYVSPEELTRDSTLHPAHAVAPLRMVIVAGSFPYRKQIEEFQRALHSGSAS